MILTVFFLLTKILQAMRTYGYEIVQTLIVDIEPDVTVKRAMNEINAGERFLSLSYVLLSHAPVQC
jgi:hypothetical protein